MAAAPLKDILDGALVRELAGELRSAHRAFDVEAFVARSTRGLDRLELTARAALIADAFHEFLPRPFARAAAVMEASLGPEIAATGENGLAPLRYLPHVSYVQKYGLDDYDAAIRLQAELTKRFSAEYSIRAFLTHHPERTYQQHLHAPSSPQSLHRVSTCSRTPTSADRPILVAEGIYSFTRRTIFGLYICC